MMLPLTGRGAPVGDGGQRGQGLPEQAFLIPPVGMAGRDFSALSFVSPYVTLPHVHLGPCLCVRLNDGICVQGVTVFSRIICVPVCVWRAARWGRSVLPTISSACVEL